MGRRGSRSQMRLPEGRIGELTDRLRKVSTSEAVTAALARILTKAPQLEEFVLEACRFTTHPIKGCIMKEVVLYRGRELPDIKLYLIVVSDQLTAKRERLLEWNLAKQIASACLSVFYSEKSQRKLRGEADELATSWGFTPVG